MGGRLGVAQGGLICLALRPWNRSREQRLEFRRLWTLYEY